jgi:hypothetical protein
MAKKEKEDFKSDWAFSEKHKKNIHISEAESGLKGYRCLGCYVQMVANIQKKNPNWLSYFSHYASDVNKEKVECVRASKTYREKIARTILNELKYVNAPAIYKYPPLGSDENLFSMKIESRRKIEAAYTRAELSFYENEDGVIKWGKNPTITDKDLLIRPDVTFFNKDNKPILFIEFIVYSKIKPDKFLKLSRLGIDTLQINIPRKSEADIEKTLKSSRTYKWVYNEKEANAKYIPISRTNTEEFSQINDNERIVFEENFKCRQAEINQLIRSIKRSLQSEQYREIEFGLNQQIQKVERNTESANQRLGDLEESNRRDAFSRNSIEEEKEDRTYRGLEKRYLDKDEEINGLFKTYIIAKSEGEEIANVIGNEEREIRDIEKRIRNIDEEVRKSIERDIRNSRGRISKIGEEQDGLGNIVFEKFRKRIESEESEIERIGREKENCEETISAKFFRDLKFNNERLPKELRDLFQEQRLINDYEDAQRKEECYKAARKFLRKRTWEKE